MKKLIYLLFLLLPFIAKGQIVNYTGADNQASIQKGGNGALIVLVIPTDTSHAFTTGTAAQKIKMDGRIAMKNGIFYAYDSIGCGCFKQVTGTGGGGGSPTDSAIFVTISRLNDSLTKFLRKGDSNIYVTLKRLSDTGVSIRAWVQARGYLTSVDSSIYQTKYGTDTMRVNVYASVNLRLKYTDTSSMLSPYMRKADTGLMLQPYITEFETDSRYAKIISLTDSMLVARDSLHNIRIDLAVALDSTIWHTKYDADTGRNNVYLAISTKLNISDTTAMLAPYMRKVDTTAMLSPYMRKADKLGYSAFRWIAYTDVSGNTTVFIGDTSTNPVSGGTLGLFGTYGQLVQRSASNIIEQMPKIGGTADADGTNLGMIRAWCTLANGTLNTAGSISFIKAGGTSSRFTVLDILTANNRSAYIGRGGIHAWCYKAGSSFMSSSNIAESALFEANPGAAYAYPYFKATKSTGWTKNVFDYKNEGGMDITTISYDGYVSTTSYLYKNTKVISSDYTVNDSDNYIYVNPAAGNIVLNFPSTLKKNHRWVVKNIASGTHTVYITSLDGASVDNGDDPLFADKRTIEVFHKDSLDYQTNNITLAQETDHVHIEDFGGRADQVIATFNTKAGNDTITANSSVFNSGSVGKGIEIAHVRDNSAYSDTANYLETIITTYVNDTTVLVRDAPDYARRGKRGYFGTNNYDALMDAVKYCELIGIGSVDNAGIGGYCYFPRLSARKDTACIPLRRPIVLQWHENNWIKLGIEDDNNADSADDYHFTMFKIFTSGNYAIRNLRAIAPDNYSYNKTGGIQFLTFKTGIEINGKCDLRDVYAVGDSSTHYPDYDIQWGGFYSNSVNLGSSGGTHTTNIQNCIAQTKVGAISMFSDTTGKYLNIDGLTTYNGGSRAMAYPVGAHANMTNGSNILNITGVPGFSFHWDNTQYTDYYKNYIVKIVYGSDTFVSQVASINSPTQAVLADPAPATITNGTYYSYSAGGNLEGENFYIDNTVSIHAKNVNQIDPAKYGWHIYSTNGKPDCFYRIYENCITTRLNTVSGQGDIIGRHATPLNVMEHCDLEYTPFNQPLAVEATDSRFRKEAVFYNNSTLNNCVFDAEVFAFALHDTVYFNGCTALRIQTGDSCYAKVTGGIIKNVATDLRRTLANVSDSLGNTYDSQIPTGNSSDKIRVINPTNFQNRVIPYTTFLTPGQAVDSNTKSNDSFFYWKGGVKYFYGLDATGGVGSGEANTASNLGGGLANFDNKVGLDLQFNSFASSDFDLASHVLSIDATLKSTWNAKLGWGDTSTTPGIATKYDNSLKLSTATAASTYALQSTTVNGHALSSNVTVTTGDLGASTVGANFFTLSNPSAITFPRINADNTVSTRTAAQIRGDIGAGTGDGTVTTVSVSSANGFGGSVSNATTTPAITITTSVTGIIKGNGTAASAASAGTDYVAPGAITGVGLTMASARLLGRTTASSGAIEEISVGTGLSLSSGTLSGSDASTASKGIASFNSSNFSVSSGAVSIKSGGVSSTEIADGSVALADMANMATASIIGRNTAGTGAPEVLSAATTKSLLSLNNVDNTSDATKNSAAATLTNKRITPRVGTTASSSTPTPDADANDIYTVTALAAGATFGAPTGTPVNGQTLLIRIKDNGTARTLAWNAIYRAGTDFALPTTTVISKTVYIQFIYNSADSKWDAIGTTTGFSIPLWLLLAFMPFKLKLRFIRRIIAQYFKKAIAVFGILLIACTANAQLPICNGWKFRGGGGGSFDTDAQAYFTAAGITDATTQSAVNQLVLDLKAASLWTSLKDLQLWTNADATKNKYNVKDPQNTDAAFRSVPGGTVTHTSNGIVGNGTTGYIDLKLNPSTVLTHNAWSMGIYSQTNNTTTAFDFGSYDGGANADGISLYNGGSIVGAGEDFGNYATGTPSSTDGFWFLSRTSSTSVSIYRNGGTAVGTNTTANGANHPNYNLYALAWNIAGSPFYYSNRKICLVIIFNAGLNSTQVGTLTTAIQAWANALGIKIL